MVLRALLDPSGSSEMNKAGVEGVCGGEGAGRPTRAGEGGSAARDGNCCLQVSKPGGATATIPAMSLLSRERRPLDEDAMIDETDARVVARCWRCRKELRGDRGASGLVHAGWATVHSHGNIHSIPSYQKVI